MIDGDIFYLTGSLLYDLYLISFFREDQFYQVFLFLVQLGREFYHELDMQISESALLIFDRHAFVRDYVPRKWLRDLIK